MRHASPETIGQVMVWMGVLLGIVIIGVLVVQRFRGGRSQKGATAGELIESFQEMRTRGDLDDMDFRKIRTVLGAQLDSKLKEGNEPPKA